MGVIVGGRLGYVLFYDLAAYIDNPALVLRIWKAACRSTVDLSGDAGSRVVWP